MNELLPITPVPIPYELKNYDPRIGPLHMESTIRANGTHRLKFTQFGRIPDMEPILARHTPQDGRYVYRTAWMDQAGTGHAYLAWKEN